MTNILPAIRVHFKMSLCFLLPHPSPLLLGRGGKWYDISNTRPEYHNLKIIIFSKQTNIANFYFPS